MVPVVVDIVERVVVEAVVIGFGHKKFVGLGTPKFIQNNLNLFKKKRQLCKKNVSKMFTFVIDGHSFERAVVGLSGNDVERHNVRATFVDQLGVVLAACNCRLSNVRLGKCQRIL